MGNLFASTGLGDEKPHERDVEYCGFAGRRPYEIQNENPEITAVHMKEGRKEGRWGERNTVEIGVHLPNLLQSQKRVARFLAADAL